MLSGFVWFNRPLSVGQRLSFSLSFRLANGDALTSWEFSQMYTDKEQVHVDKKPLGRAIEYFGRTVWFPVKTLKLRVTLPTSIGQSPVPGVFSYANSRLIVRSDVARSVKTPGGTRRVLQYYPAQGSPWRVKRRLAIQKQLPPPFDKGFFKSISPRTWELSAHMPTVGSSYSLEWTLPERIDNPHSRIVIADVTNFRKRLLDYRSLRKRRYKRPSRIELFRRYFIQLYEALHRCLGIPKNDFEVLLMTYDETRRRLVTTHGIKNGHGLDSRTWDFWLPFGLGLAGSCFKQSSAFISEIERAEDVGRALDYYLPIAGRRRPKFLTTVPLEHPIFKSVIEICRKGEANGKEAPKTQSREIREMYAQLYKNLLSEPSRQCIGVVNITSMRHSPAKIGRTKMAEIVKLCQEFCSEVYGSLSTGPDRASH